MAMEVSDLSRLLSSLSLGSDKQLCRSIMSKVYREQVKGSDLKKLLPAVMKLMAHHDLVVKKAVYNFLATYTNQNPDVGLLSVNTLSQECSDSNPMVRGLALRTLCSLNHESFVEYGLRAISRGLTDQSAYVRRAAVICYGRIYKQNIEIYNDAGLIDQLYKMLRDSDPIVVINAVLTLESILKEEGGIVINKNIAHHLLNKLDTYTSWGQSYIFTIVKKYKPRNEDERFDIMNLLDSYLTHNNASVSTECLKLFLHLIEGMPHLEPEVFCRSFECISRAFGHGNTELIFVLLEHLLKYLQNYRPFLQRNHHILYCKHKDPSFLKLKKLEILPHAANAENIDEVMGEIAGHGKSADSLVSQNAIRAIGEVIRVEPSSAGLGVMKLKQLLESNDKHIFSATLQVLQGLDYQLTENIPEMISVISSKLSLLTEEKGKLSFLRILYHFSDSVMDSPYILEEFIENNEGIESVVVKCHLLNTCVKVFFSHPAATQGMLGRLLEAYVQDSCAMIRDSAMFYYSILSQDVKSAESILL